MLLSPSVGKCCLRRWSGMKWTSCFITFCRERLSASETQVHQTLRQLHRGNKGQREGETGMSPLDQLIGQPETEEQLRKLVALFSEVQRWRPKVHKTEFFIPQIRDLSFFFFPAVALSNLKRLSDSSTALRCVISIPAFEIFINILAFHEKVSAKICIFKPKLNIYNTFPLSYIPASLADFPFLGQRLTSDHTWPRVATWMSELILFKQYQQNASHSVLEQIQPFALVLAMCTINNSQQTWSMPGKAVEWAVSRKHRKGLLGVSECWCIPIIIIHEQWINLPLLKYGYPNSDARLSLFNSFLFDNIETQVFKRNLKWSHTRQMCHERQTQTLLLYSCSHRAQNI